MRDIKFRAWDKDNKKMVEIYQMQFLKRGLAIRRHTESRGTGGWDFEEINNYNLMQYTGIKDKNGKEIYEGDIVEGEKRHNEIGMNQIFKVEWESNRWFFHQQNNKGKYAGLGLDGFYVTKYELNKTFEIIGNIYEHKHLLNENS